MHWKRFILPTLALVGALLAGCGGDGANEADTATTAIPTDGAAFNDADIEFAQQMITHHAQAVDMAEMVPDHGTSAGLRELADAIGAAQQPEIDQMTAMLEEWGQDVPLTDGGHAGHSEDMQGMMSDDEMNTLAGVSGGQFEQMWMTMMIEHHEGAIAMSEFELDEGVNAAARRLAEQIIETQQAEIAQMQAMLDSKSE
jgi:uncharacterized protein (DUF305 family)